MSALTNIPLLSILPVVHHLLIPTDHVDILGHAVVMISPPTELTVVIKQVRIVGNLALFPLLQILTYFPATTPTITEAPLWSGAGVWLAVFALIPD